jgi:hypothetical protein
MVRPISILAAFVAPFSVFAAAIDDAERHFDEHN